MPPQDYSPQPAAPQPTPPAPAPGHPAEHGHPGPGAHPPEPKSKGPTSDKTLMIRIGIVAGVVVVILVVVLLIAAGGGKKNSPTTSNNTDQLQGPQPATSLDVDQANNAISQDLASLHDDTDFPNNTLDDKTLGL